MMIDNMGSFFSHRVISLRDEMIVLALQDHSRPCTIVSRMLMSM